MKVIVIGGVAAGMSAASKLKRLDAAAEVVVYEKGGYLSYGACGLPYYISNVNDDYRRMIIRSREQFEESGIICRLHHEVLEVNTKEKYVLVRNLEDGNTFRDHYDRLMISTGAHPVVPGVNGIDLEGVYTLHSMEDGQVLKERLMAECTRDVVIVGAGYIGMEMAEAMAELNKNVTVIELADHVLASFDSEISEIVERVLVKNGVSLRLQEKLLEIKGDVRVSEITTSKGTYRADAVILALGIRPSTEFLRESGITLAKNGAVIIDREMKTNKEDIYAAGDCAEVYHFVKKKNSYIPLGTTANKCGRIAGENLAGNHAQYIGALGSAAIKVFDHEAARTGLSEAEAKELGLDYNIAFVEAMDRPPYYPDPSPIWIKLIYEKETKKILGAQAAGKKGVVLRIDIFAASIQVETPTHVLGMADLCYAPPYSGVWDAVHIACNAAK